jgi:hypothetical protein
MKGGNELKYIGYCIGLFTLTIGVWMIVAGVLGKSSEDAELFWLVVIAIQNCTIVTFLIYIVERIKKKEL